MWAPRELWYTILYMIDIAANLKRIMDSRPRELRTDESTLRRALELAVKAHDGQLRKSGEPYVIHPVEIACVLGALGMDTTTMVAGLLHDVPEDTAVGLEVVEKEFGKDVAHLVDGVTKLGHVRLKGSHEDVYLENLRKMFLAMASDIRVVIVKLADRLHNMRTLNHVASEKQERIARETLEIYAPIANRLGMGGIKVELEDLAFAYLEPERFAEVERISSEFLHDGEGYLTKTKELLRDLLKKSKVAVVDIQGRTKQIYRLAQKLDKHGDDIQHIYDLLALRLIVPTVADCYESLGVIHREYRPMVGRIKDYISLPKPNGYRSLHTTVFGPEGRIIEIQIRTEDMHLEAEMGIAAHWFYTERSKSLTNSIKNRLLFRKNTTVAPKELAWVQSLREWQLGDGTGDEDFLKTVKIEFFQNHIFAFTPKGDIIDLPEGSTALDFAYAIHSEIGDRTTGVKANGKMVSLDTPVKNGQVLEVMTTKEMKKPNKNWLQIVKTTNAKARIRRSLREE